MHHRRTLFSILSFCRDSAPKICLYTDAPHLYRMVYDRVELVLLSKKRLAKWQGSHGDVFRPKIMLTILISRRFGGDPAILIDGDTVLTGHWGTLESSLRAGKALMHRSEGAFADIQNPAQRKVWGQLQGKAFGGIEVGRSFVMWNAGVIGLPPQSWARISDLARVYGAVSAACHYHRLSEQISVGIVLQRVFEIVSAQSVVRHYWANKRRRDSEIDKFLGLIDRKRLGINYALALMRVPGFFESLRTRALNQ